MISLFIYSVDYFSLQKNFFTSYATFLDNPNEAKN